MPAPDAGAGYFVPSGSGSRHEIAPGVEIRTTATSGMMLSVVHFEAGSQLPDHSHPHQQMGVLVSGRLEFVIGGLTRILGPGDVWRIPGGVPHRARAIEGPAEAIDVFHPIREDYL
ncbi:cupin domain-containing protein [Aquisphaera giovannonii]|uniref:cupin domain-containing protein n=1 Tax=Aquisphaera giovannonii TaxID=406548 RepID=UPI001FE6B688|nr:cupin domain-containing protein [Aquisphaera giovannonii]